MKIAMGKKGHGQGLGLGLKGTKGTGMGTKGEGLGILQGKGFKGLRESNGKEGIEGIERSLVTGLMGVMGVEETTGLGLPTHRAISCDQLAFELQRECYSIPVLHVRESGWPVKITPMLEMPGYTGEFVTLPGRVAPGALQPNTVKPVGNSELTDRANEPADCDCAE